MRQTEEECHLCDDGVYLRDNAVKYCNECFHTPLGESRPLQTPDNEWQSFWEYRTREYDGTYGESRKKCVGGFAGIYFVSQETDDLIAGD